MDRVITTGRRSGVGKGLGLVVVVVIVVDTASSVVTGMAFCRELEIVAYSTDGVCAAASAKPLPSGVPHIGKTWKKREPTPLRANADRLS